MTLFQNKSLKTIFGSVSLLSDLSRFYPQLRKCHHYPCFFKPIFLSFISFLINEITTRGKLLVIFLPLMASQVFNQCEKFRVPMPRYLVNPIEQAVEERFHSPFGAANSPGWTVPNKLADGGSRVTFAAAREDP